MPTQEEKDLSNEIKDKIDELNDLLFTAWFEKHLKVEMWRQDLNSRPFNVNIINPDGFLL